MLKHLKHSTLKLCTTSSILCIILLSGCEKPPEPPKTIYDLKPPFDVSAIRETSGKRDINKFTCKPAPKPSYDLFFESMYDKSSKNSSIVDPEAHETYKTQTKNIKDLEVGLAQNANRYILSKPPEPFISHCVMEWLVTWAKNDGLLGKSNHMGEFVRKWALSSIALSYVQIRDDAQINEDDRMLVKSWIRKLGERVIDDFSKNPDLSSRNNNHMYWAAWGVTAAGIALDDRTFFDWGVVSAKRGIANIQADGTLPLELARGPKAYNYHHYAAIPLFMIADTAEKNGVDLYSENKQGLKRLARVLLENMEDQSYFVKLTGEKQNLNRTITQSNLSWLEPYYDHYHDPLAIKWLVGYRPVKHSRVGGNATLLYGLDPTGEP